MFTRWLTSERSRWAYLADLYLYGAAALGLAAALLLAGPPDLRLVGVAMAGMLAWTLLEYLLHRFVLHGLQPLRRWHAEHHRHPRARIAAPAALSATLFAVLLLPAIWWPGPWPAAALGLGLLGGYTAYGLIHHAIHQPSISGRVRAGGRWLQRRRQWHGLHHQRVPAMAGSNAPSAATPGYYGVSTAFWDRVFGTDHRQVRRRNPACAAGRSRRRSRT